MSASDATDADLFDVVTAPSIARPGADAVTVELDPGDAAALAALAARLHLESGAIWRAGWALVLARLIGVERVRVGGAAEIGRAHV